MKRYPAAAEEKLGFEVLRERLHRMVRSTLGADRLDRMRPSSNRSWIEAELGRVTELQEAFRFDDPVPLDHVRDLRSTLQRAAPEGAMVDAAHLWAVRQVLDTVAHTRSYFTARREKYPHLSRIVQHFHPLAPLKAHIESVIDAEGMVRDDASPELRRLRRRILQQQQALREALLRELRQAIGQGYATEEQPTIRNGRMVIPVRAEAKRKVSGFVQDTSGTGQTVYIEPAACLHLNNEVRALEGAERAEIERILRAATAALHDALPQMQDNVRTLAAFDLLQAKARLSNQLDAIVPALNEDGIIEIRGARNPILQLHFQRENEASDEDMRAVVPLDLQLGDTYHTLVITGPNAGGKSVAMKTVGLLALMLAYGLPIPVAPASRFALFARLIVDLGDEQSIEEDLSTFSSHVANLNYMMRHANDRTLILIDEAGTGTDPAEGSALAQAVLERLTETGARTIATTHHGALKAFAHAHPGVENGSMQFDRTTLSPTYRFQPGVPGSSYAFDIAQRNGLPKPLLQRARTLIGTQKAALEDLITTFERRTQALQQQLKETEDTLRQARAEKKQYEERAAQLRNERDTLQQRALTEAERIVGEANARVEKTIREIKEAEAAKEATRAARADLEAYKSKVTQKRKKTERKQKKALKKAHAVPKETPSTPQKISASPLQVGDQVVVDGGNTAAEVLAIDKKGVQIALGTMRMRVRQDRLQKVGGRRKQEVMVRQFFDGGTNLPALQASNHLNIRGKRVEEALMEVTLFVDQALAANLDRLEILHGKGTGALRQAIHEYLSQRPDVAHFEDAPWNQGGAGVTIVTMR